MTTVAGLETYRNATPYPFCPGCGHHAILDAMDRALVQLELDPSKVVLVSDIGCAGLSDQYFATSAFHGLHGRSVTYAAGIKMARPELEVLVVMGDGGTGIGGTHLINAARRNVGITVLVFNNFNFGMTGGQHSTTTPEGAITSTTPGGNLERPLDICGTVAVNGAGWVGRATTFDDDLTDRIAEAISAEGFSLLDVWELCTAYFVPRNRLSRRSLDELLERLGFARGVLARNERPEYAAAYRAAAVGSEPGAAPAAFQPAFRSPLDRRFALVAAGAAGGKVRSAARLVGQGAILSGLWASQRDDYPVTVQTGHSLSEVVLSPEPIDYSGIERPDAVLLLAPEGIKKAASRLARLGPDSRLFTLPGLPPVETSALVTVLDPAAAGRRLKPSQTSAAALAAVVELLGLFPLEALEAAAESAPETVRETLLAAVQAGAEVARAAAASAAP